MLIFDLDLYLLLCALSDQKNKTKKGCLNKKILQFTDRHGLKKTQRQDRDVLYMYYIFKIYYIYYIFKMKTREGRWTGFMNKT